jgi:hypothetical protein
LHLINDKEPFFESIAGFVFFEIMSTLEILALPEKFTVNVIPFFDFNTAPFSESIQTDCLMTMLSSYSPLSNKILSKSFASNNLEMKKNYNYSFFNGGIT